MSDDFNKSGDLFVTEKKLDETRSELKSDITALRMETNAGFKKMDARFNEVDARFDKMEGMFNHLMGMVAEIKSDSHRTLAIVEEQNNRNKFVMEAQNALQNQVNQQQTLNNERFDHIDASIKAVKKGH